MSTATFRIGNCNAENFNVPGVRYAGRLERDGDPVPRDTHANKVGWLSRLLDGAKVDLVGFQELFHREAIEALLDATPHLRGAAIYAPDLDDNIVNGEATGPFCGLVTRFPILTARAISVFPDDVRGHLRVQHHHASRETIGVAIEEFRRPVLRAEVQLREETVATVFVAHLKSKGPQVLDGEAKDDPVVQALGKARSLILRAAEAAALRSLVIAASDEERPIIVLGDLNDGLTSVTTQMIAGDEPWALEDASGDVQAGRYLHSAHQLQQRLAHGYLGYSHVHQGRYELLDHIFVSGELVGHHPRPIANVRNTRIYADHLFDWRQTSDGEPLSGATSDHGVVVTEMAWRRPPVT